MAQVKKTEHLEARDTKANQISKCSIKISLPILLWRCMERIKKKNLILTLNCVGFLDLSTEGETNIGLPFNLVLSMDRAACTEA